MREEIGLVNLGEVELYLEDVGPEDAPVLAVLHGGPGGSSYALREGLEDELESFRVLYFDQRGSGRSPELPAEPRLFTLDALVEDLEALREYLEVESWTLLSHGFGALVALEYARRWPGPVRNLILINPWTNFPWLAAQLYRGALELQGLDPQGPEEALPHDPEALLAEAFSALEPKAVFDHLMFPSAHSRMEYEWVAEGAGLLGLDTPGQMFVKNGLWRLDYTAYLVEQRAPLTVIVGEQDGTAYPEAQTVADLTGGGLEGIAGAGHYPWIDQPYAFAEALRLGLEASDQA
ncbi:MAG: alpha/beta hydrolase [Thermaceae bacterium]|nr:alpha/beta hydrolase [Thermaceae bacterium]